MLIQPLLAPPHPSGGRGRPPLDQRVLVNGMLWKLRHRKPWRAIPLRYGSHQACYSYYCDWNRSGLMKKILAALKYDLKERGGFDFFDWVWDGRLLMIRRRGKHVFYVHPEYMNDWRVSTALIFYNNFFQKRERLYSD
jgi:transposase